MRTYTFVKDVHGGIFAGAQALVIENTNPAALEMCPNINGLDESYAQIAGVRERHGLRHWNFYANYDYLMDLVKRDFKKENIDKRGDLITKERMK